VGQAAASRSVEVRSQVTGVIVARPYAEGTDVAKGTLLFRIDPTTYEAAYRSAQARLANADRTLARLKPLLASAPSPRRTWTTRSRRTTSRRRPSIRRGKTTRTPSCGPRSRAAPARRVGARRTGDRFERPADDGRAGDPIYVNFSPSDEDLLRLRRDIADGRLLMPPAPHALAVQVTLADAVSFRPRAS